MITHILAENRCGASGVAFTETEGHIVSERAPQSFLPLTPLTFGILVALADRARSGYGIVREIEERSGGTMSPGTGTVYVALQRLMNDGLLEESPEPADAPHDKRARRWYRVTALGSRVLTLEARRLSGVLRLAAERGVPGDIEVPER